MKNVRKKRNIPAVAAETQEADWCYQNRKKLDKEFLETGRAGTLKVLDRKALMERVSRSKASRVISIRLPYKST